MANCVTYIYAEFTFLTNFQFFAMIKLYKKFQNLWKNRPRFNIKYIMMECPGFIVNLIQGKQHNKTGDDVFIWDDNYRKQLNLKR
jgi:hypothetical protein